MFTHFTHKEIEACTRQAIFAKLQVGHRAESISISLDPEFLLLNIILVPQDLFISLVLK